MNSLMTSRRMYRLFRDDGRSLVIALDHGSGLNVYPALADPGHVIDAALSGKADAVLTTPGILKQFTHHLKSIGVILRLDGGCSELAKEPTAYKLLHSVEDALRLGADAVACMGFPGTSFESQTLENVAHLAGQCQSWNVPLMAEMLPGGFTQTDQHTVENTRLAVRIGIELGADFIKTQFIGPAESFRQVTENCYRPLLVLGGNRTHDERALFNMVKSALDSGAAGVAIGRNVWHHPRPRAIITALNQIIHHGATVEEALTSLTALDP